MPALTKSNRQYTHMLTVAYTIPVIHNYFEAPLVTSGVNAMLNDDNYVK